MRFFTVCLLGLCCLISCREKGKPVSLANVLKDSSSYTSIEWIDSVNRDFGKIYEGQKLQVTFRFRNTGSKPLVIAKVQPSCGCTVAEQPEEPVGPGQTGEIKAIFNSEDRVGMNHKTLFVYANTRIIQEHTLQFLVEVEKRKM